MADMQLIIGLGLLDHVPNCMTTKHINFFASCTFSRCHTYQKIAGSSSTDALINQSYYCALKSWSESWPTLSVKRRNK